MITQKDISKAITKFRKQEQRGGFYDMAVNLFEERYEIEAYIIILATWNFAVFRYAVKQFDIIKFKEIIECISPYFDKMKNENVKTIIFHNYKKDIIKIFDTLSQIEGIKFTGASKLMHLRNRNVFIIWDNYIRGNKPKKYYAKLNIVKKGLWKPKKYGNNAESYYQFLNDMQKLFKNVNFQDDKKTFAKAIDEYNYVNITLPIQKMESEKNKSYI